MLNKKGKFRIIREKTGLHFLDYKTPIKKIIEKHLWKFPMTSPTPIISNEGNFVQVFFLNKV